MNSISPDRFGESWLRYKRKNCWICNRMEILLVKILITFLSLYMWRVSHFPCYALALLPSENEFGLIWFIRSTILHRTSSNRISFWTSSSTSHFKFWILIDGWVDEYVLYVHELWLMLSVIASHFVRDPFSFLITSSQATYQNYIPS